MKRNLNSWKVALLAGPLALGACDLKVSNPGPINDENLNSPDALAGLVTGASFDFSRAFDNVVIFSGITSGELGHGGSYPGPGFLVRGIIHPEDINSYWADEQRARWVAEDAARRIKTVLGDAAAAKDPNLARADLLAGFANRTLGEIDCNAVIDGGPSQPNSEYFKRGEQYFTEAIAVGQAAGKTDIVTAAYGGRASVRAWQGNWTGAVSDAQQVPPTFHYDAVYLESKSDNQNEFVFETFKRAEYTVFGTPWAQVFGDPRVPWDTAKSNGRPINGANGQTPMFRQEKYTSLGSGIPLTTGTEMLVLRAEAALRNNDIAGMTALLNQARAVYKMAPIAQPADKTAAWQVLKFERGATVWLQGRSLWDQRRFFAESDPAIHSNFLQGRDQCMPISADEKLVNPNLHG